MRLIHVAVVDRGTAGRLLRGFKRVESRFYCTRRVPFGRIRVGDTIHFKLSGGAIIGCAGVTRVRQFADLDRDAISRLRRRYNRAICAPARYWAHRRRSRYGLLIWITRLCPPLRPVEVPRQYGNGWVVLRGG